jgi:hypothetical protein
MKTLLLKLIFAELTAEQARSDVVLLLGGPR